MEILELLEAKGIHYVRRAKDEFAIVCPNEASHGGGSDARPSFNINVDKVKAHCFACGFSLSGESLLSWLTGGALEELEFRTLVIKAKIKQLQAAPIEGISEARQVMIPPGKPWDEDGFRGISLATYKMLGGIKCDRGFYSNRIVFPVYIGGDLAGVDARALGDEQPKYLRNKGSSCGTDWLFPYDIVAANRPKQVIIAEGIFHAINALDKGFDALCYFGANNFSRTKLRMLIALGVDEVIYFRDNDKAGTKAEQQICSMLVDWLEVTSAYTAHIEEGKDLGDLTKEEIEFALEHRRKPLIPTCLAEGRSPEVGSRCVSRCPFRKENTCMNVFW